MIQELINTHNDMVKKGMEHYNQLKESGLQILELFKTLNKEDTIKYYDMMDDSVIKFDLLLQIKKQWIKK